MAGLGVVGVVLEVLEVFLNGDGQHEGGSRGELDGVLGELGEVCDGGYSERGGIVEEGGPMEYRGDRRGQVEQEGMGGGVDAQQIGVSVTHIGR